MSIVIGVVLVWRVFRYVLGGIVIGLVVLYLPDKDLKEIEKLWPKSKNSSIQQ